MCMGVKLFAYQHEIDIFPWGSFFISLLYLELNQAVELIKAYSDVVWLRGHCDWNVELHDKISYRIFA